MSMTQEERAAMDHALAQLKEQDALLQQLTNPPLDYGSVITIRDSEVMVSHGAGTIKALERPSPETKIFPGVAVLLAGTGQIVRAIQPIPTGQIAMLEEVDYTRGEGGFARVEMGGAPRRVILPPNFDQEPKKGDSVILDSSGSIATILIAAELEVSVPDQLVEWDDIGGLDEAKLTLREIVEYAFTHDALYRQYGKRPPKGILFFGPPGCGKTMLAKALAAALARAHKTEKSGFFYTKTPEMLNPYVGVTEQNIRRVFAKGAAYHNTTGATPVLFWDEADALFYRRGLGRSMDVERTIVPTFLTEVDGLEGTSAVVILATNRVDTLDPAVTREGRMDRKIRIKRPDRDGFRRIIYLNLRGLFGESEQAESFAGRVTEDVFDPARSLGKYAKGKVELQLGHIVSGGMGVTIVETAKQFALRRDIRSNSSLASGVTSDDLHLAVDQIHTENKGLNHETVLYELKEAANDAA